MPNEVVWYHSGEPGAPTINNAAGSMINVLDACLITGFNVKSVTSIVVASNVATVTASAHGYQSGKIVSHSGATPSGLNGRAKITVTGANTYTFPTTGIADGSASGTITARRAPLGWTKVFSGTNKAIYSRTDPAATSMLLRIDDTGTAFSGPTFARALMVEAATGIDTFTNQAPVPSFFDGGGQIWSKGANTTDARPWVLVGDGRTLWFFTDHEGYPFTSYGCLHPRMFGDIESYRTGDAYACAVVGDETTGAQSSWWTGGSSSSAVFMRSFNGIALAPGAYMALQYANPSGGATAPIYPSPVNNGMVIGDRLIAAEANGSFNHPIRGVYRGVKVPYANLQGSLHLNVLTGITGFSGELLCVGGVGQGNPGALLFDITGPWA